ncbi:hypothetical protein IJM86_01165 [bacterium]|nr:hypothetical protein [bacterium]
MFLYDESKVFQDTLDSFRSFDVENVIQTISFIFSKEEADLPLDFKDTWISEIKKEINELITLYETTFKEYENLF